MSSLNLLSVALDYHKRGWNVLPVEGKRPVVSGWKQWQTQKMDAGDINRLETYWKTATGIAVVCGPVSGNLVVIDLDGQFAVDLFYKQFPQLTKTYTVKTGNGLHLYYYQHHHFITDDKAVYKLAVASGEIAVRVENCYVVAPPSLHETGVRYEICHGWKIKRTALLGRVLLWMKRHKRAQDLFSSVETKQIDVPAAPNGNKAALTKSIEPAQIDFELPLGGNNAPLTESDRHQKWAQTALTEEVEKVRSAGKGERNDRLYHAALKLGSIIAGSYLSRSQVESTLMSGADICGLVKDDGKAQCEKTIKSGIEAGMQNPRHPEDKPLALAKHDVDSPPSAAMPEENKPLIKGHKPTDDELGNEMIEECDGNYCYFFGAWNEYDKGVWKMMPRFKRKIWQILIRNKHLGIRPTDSKATSVEKYLQMELFVDDDKIDASTDYINLQNGLYNLKTGKLEAHSREWYMTSQLPFSYDPKATCPTFATFVNQVLVTPDGKPDTDLIQLVKQAFGYSLTADTSLRTSFWLVGPSGSGKSTLLNALIELAGNSHVAIDLNEMQNTSYQLADIAGKRVVTFTEPDSNTVLADGQYKRLVSQDTITARQVYGKPFRFVPIAKLWGGMNDTPRLVDRSDAIHNRVLIIPMNYVVPRDKWDIQLIDKIRLELAGVFNWSIDGLQSLRQTRKWHRSQQVDDARAEYKAENDIEAAFVEEWCVCGADYNITSQRLFDAYKAWCNRNGYYAKGKRKVSKDWKRLGFQSYKNNLIYYRGIQLSESANKFI